MFDALASTSGLFIQICMILIHCLVFREQFFRFRTFCSSSATFNSISRQLLFVKNFFQGIFSLPSSLAAFRCAAAVSFQPLSADDLYYVTRLDEFCQGFILIIFSSVYTIILNDISFVMCYNILKLNHMQFPTLHATRCYRSVKVSSHRQ